MVTDLLKEGAQLMLVGMGVVFSLLGLMVLAVKGMSRFAALFPEPAVAASEPSSIQGSTGSDAAMIAAITTCGTLDCVWPVPWIGRRRMIFLIEPKRATLVLRDPGCPLLRSVRWSGPPPWLPAVSYWLLAVSL